MRCNRCFTISSCGRKRMAAIATLCRPGRAAWPAPSGPQHRGRGPCPSAAPLGDSSTKRTPLGRPLSTRRSRALIAASRWVQSGVPSARRGSGWPDGRRVRPATAFANADKRWAASNAAAAKGIPGQPDARSRQHNAIHQQGRPARTSAGGSGKLALRLSRDSFSSSMARSRAAWASRSACSAAA